MINRPQRVWLSSLTLRQAHRIPGTSCGILRDHGGAARGFGYADVERAVPVTPETPFKIASVTKPISAVLPAAGGSVGPRRTGQ